MVFAKYFFVRFFKSILLIDLLLAFVVNFIEFFEKIVHVHTALQTILNFVVINFIPSFFELLPIACWLASCLLIKEFYQQNEWETFWILNITNKTMLKLAIFCGLTIAGMSFIFREIFVDRMIFISEQYRMENFKQKPVQKIIGKWLEVAPNTLVYFGMLDFSTNSGTDFLILYLDSQFTVKTVISGQNFVILPNKNEIIINSGTLCNVDDNAQERFLNKHMILPMLFSQLKINLHPATLLNLLKNTLNKKFLPIAAQRVLQQQIVNKIEFYFKLILYPTLTFALFMLFWHSSILKWVMIFTPYPFFICYSLISDYIIAVSMSPWIVLILYILLLGVIYLIFFTKKLRNI